MLSGFLLLPLIEVKIKQATLKTFLKKKKKSENIFFYVEFENVFSKMGGKRGFNNTGEGVKTLTPITFHTPSCPNRTPPTPYSPPWHPPKCFDQRGRGSSWRKWDLRTWKYGKFLHIYTVHYTVLLLGKMYSQMQTFLRKKCEKKFFNVEFENVFFMPKCQIDFS